MWTKKAHNGDIVLRVVLIVVWTVLMVVNGIWLKDWTLLTPFWEGFTFGIFDFVLVYALWLAFKRDNCVCWDDIDNHDHTDTSIGLRYKDDYSTPTANDMRWVPDWKPPVIPEDESHTAKWQQVINESEWQSHDHGESFGHGGLNG